MVCKQYGIHMYALKNAPCPYINYSNADGSLEPKHVADSVLMTIYVLCLFK